MTPATLRAVVAESGAPLVDVLAFLDRKPLPEETLASIARAVDKLGFSHLFPFVLGASTLTQKAQ